MFSEQLLSDWTALNLQESEDFTYKNNQQFKQDTLNFNKKYENRIPERPNPPTTVSKLIHLWESRIKYN